MTAHLSCVLVLLAAGCDRVWQLDPLEPRHDAGADADLDGPPDIGIDARACFGSPQGLFQTCLTAPLDGPLFLSGIFDTTNDSRCRQVVQSTGRPVCVIAAESVTVSTAVVVRGARPLVLIAGDFIQIDAPVDGSSTAGRSGPGAKGLGECDTDGNGGNSAMGGAGGSGGTFGYRGGAAQHGGGVFTTAHPASVPVALLDVRGGCVGYTAGISSNVVSTAAKGGAGGGAIYLIAGNRITVSASGKVNASGAGGQGGPIRGGGGGGGGGGLFAFDAPKVTLDGAVFARGGGGGSGGSDMTEGNRGSEPAAAAGSTTGGTTATPGSGSGPGWPGCGGPNGTTGGNTDGTAATAGGGGGGGACGYIFVYAENKVVSAATSPAIQP